MGLDDILPDDADKQGSSSRKSEPKPENDPDKKVIGQGANQKVFDQEDWEAVKKVLREDMGYNVNKVLHGTAGSERYEILHEAIMKVRGKLDEDEMEHKSPNKCIVCGKATDEVGVEVAGEYACVHHTIGQLEKALNN